MIARILILSLSFAWVAPIAQASQVREGWTTVPFHFAKKTREMTKAQAIQRARAKFGGEPLSAQRVEKPKGHPRYRIKLLSDGQVRVVWVDAVSGAVSSD